MKIGINIGCYPCPLNEQFDLMEKNGFTATFTGSEHPKLDEIMKNCRERRIEMESYHAPFANINALWRVVRMESSFSQVSFGVWIIALATACRRLLFIFPAASPRRE